MKKSEYNEKGNKKKKTGRSKLTGDRKEVESPSIKTPKQTELGGETAVSPSPLGVCDCLTDSLIELNE